MAGPLQCLQILESGLQKELSGFLSLLLCRSKAPSAFPCKENCTTVLRGIANDTHNYCTNKQLAEAKFFTCCLDRGHQYLAYHYDTCHAYGKEQKRLFLAPVCAVAFLYVLRSFRWRKQVFVGNERENYPKNVNDQQNDC